jgi:hypothetical protein
VFSDKRQSNALAVIKTFDTAYRLCTKSRFRLAAEYGQARVGSFNLRGLLPEKKRAAQAAARYPALLTPRPGMPGRALDFSIQ